LFVFKNIHWLLFLILVYISLALINHNTGFQRSQWMAVVREFTGNVYTVSNSFRAYLHLNTINEQLSAQIAELETRVSNYEAQIANYRLLQQDSLPPLPSQSPYKYIAARVINNTTTRSENYLTLNKGADEGLGADMGVLTVSGVVGMVEVSSSHFSRVISILNPKFKLSCMLKSNQYAGPLVWDGKDSRYTYLTELPVHITTFVGDTVVTSGYSAVFPKNIPVGVVESLPESKNGIYASIKVRLFVDFNNINEVRVVSNEYRKDQLQVEMN
jgi:rod shape-determining protein MreC